jgi:hypothetical protein
VTTPALHWRETLEGLCWTLDRPQETRALVIGIEATFSLESLASRRGPAIVDVTGTLHGVGIAEGASLAGRLVVRPPGRLVYDGVFASEARPSCRMAGEKHFFWLAPLASATGLHLSFYDDADLEFGRGIVRSTFATDLRHLLRTVRVSGVPGLALLRSALLQ